MEKRLWAAACFFAIQAIEKALKSLARRPTTFSDLEHVTLGDLENFTYREIGTGGIVPERPPHRLIELLDSLRPWWRCDLDGFRSDLNWIDTENIYMATRYPDAPTSPTRQASASDPPYARFTQQDAVKLNQLAREVLAVVKRRSL